MAILIDGYNLLHVTGIFGRGRGPGTLERSRRALLNFLAESIEPADLRRTTVVFDAADPPFGLPRTVNHNGITVVFASSHASADEMIEELIAANSAPKRLVVVSSDHRLHRAARRRRSTAIDSDIWYGQLVEQRRDRQMNSPPVMLEPDELLSEGQVEYWLAHFDARPQSEEGAAAKRSSRIPRAPRKPMPKRAAGGADNAGIPAEQNDPPPQPPHEPEKPFNPFPPGYAEDA
jgi:predicted RNA-binding protein with PIN domain